MAWSHTQVRGFHLGMKLSSTLRPHRFNLHLLSSSSHCPCVQAERYSQQLEAEQHSVAALRSSLQARETELTRATDQFLQEKVATARAHGELSALRGRLNRYVHCM